LQSLISSSHSSVYFLLAAHITAALMGLYALYVAGFKPFHISKFLKGGR